LSSKWVKLNNNDKKQQQQKQQEDIRIDGWRLRNLLIKSENEKQTG
jgi:hypothetical protein